VTNAFATVALALSCMAFVFGCSASYEEKWRLQSPDGRVDAVWVEVNAGATMDFYYHLYIVRSGDKPERGTHRLIADRISNLRASWRRPKQLERLVRYGSHFWFS
jgi:hypothetical protein